MLLLMLGAVGLAVFYLMSDREDSMTETAGDGTSTWTDAERESYDNGDYV